jgi:large subunit ribosomal protein L10
MKKLGLIFKEASQEIIKNRLKESSAFLVVRYAGLSSPDLTLLRQALKGARAGMFVVKNSLARRALKDTGFEDIVKSIEGPCGFVFMREEPVGISKILYTFAKEHELLQFAGGMFNNRLIDKQDIESMAKLPPRDVLIAQVVGGIKSPIMGLVFVLSGTLRKLVSCLDQIAKKKSSRPAV